MFEMGAELLAKLVSILSFCFVFMSFLLLPNCKTSKTCVLTVKNGSYQWFSLVLAHFPSNLLRLPKAPSTSAYRTTTSCVCNTLDPKIWNLFFFNVKSGFYRHLQQALFLLIPGQPVVRGLI